MEPAARANSGSLVAGGVLQVGENVLKGLGSLSDQEWLARMEALGDRVGSFRWLGSAHAALFAHRKQTLIVTFETTEAIRRRHNDPMPMGYALAEAKGWSHLCVMALGQTWYRDPAVFAFFDEMVDEAFFEDFDQIVFYGSGMAGYAAAAFCVTAPGATAILVQPQATLDPAVTAWDARFREFRRLDFNDRYGYAPDMTEGADRIYVIFDPEQAYDAMHAALFRRSFTSLLACRNIGSDLEGALTAMHILPSALVSAAIGAFDEEMFWTFYRARRNHVPYLRKLQSKLEADGRPYLAAMVARNAGERLNDDRFRARADELRQKLRRAGIRLPGEADD